MSIRKAISKAFIVPEHMVKALYGEDAQEMILKN